MMTSSHHQTPSSFRRANLNYINYLNVMAYIGNVLVTYGFGTMGWFNAKTNSELSEKYQTLVTPAGWAFSIWAIIFISQLIFTITQLLPTYRLSALVQDGIKYYYVCVCLAQMAWTAAFSLEYILLSLIAMLTILIFLLAIVTTQDIVVEDEDNNGNDENNKEHYWLLRFPFLIHCGWIIAATFVNINVLFVKLHSDSILQISVACGSLVGIVVIAVINLSKSASLSSSSSSSRPEFVIPTVLVWATAGIYSELLHPKTLIINTFSTHIITWVRMGSFFVWSNLAGLIVYVAYKEIKNKTTSTNGDNAADGGGIEEATASYSVLQSSPSDDE